ncbi:MAG TPA: hypothetical protein VKX16_10690 [Chloroflexota bacterium]|nr:hypothetical protein [Chloroflexota bacterium]
MNGLRRLVTAASVIGLLGAVAPIGGAAATATAGAPLRARHVVHRAQSGFSFAYADTGGGTICGSTPDAIDVFDAAGNLLQTYPTGASENCEPFDGLNTIGLVRTKGANACLVLADGGMGGGQSGAWDSFAVSTSTGLITRAVSHQADSLGPNGIVTPPQPMFGTTQTGAIEVMTLKPSCQLTPPSPEKGDTGLLAAVATLNVQKQVIAANSSTGSLDVFNAKLRLLKKNQASFSCCVGVATAGSNPTTITATGRTTVGTATYAGGKGSITWGGTATDPSVDGMTRVLVPPSSQCIWTQVDANHDSNQLGGVSSFQYHPPQPGFIGDTLVTGALPEATQYVGGELWSIDRSIGEIEVSQVNSDCTVTEAAGFAALSDTAGYPTGLAFQ